jgi:hypothetical protein
MHWYHIEWVMWRPCIALPTSKKLMWGICITLIQQFDVMHNNLGEFPILLVCMPFTLLSNIMSMKCITFLMQCIVINFVYFGIGLVFIAEIIQ